MRKPINKPGKEPRTLAEFDMLHFIQYGTSGSSQWVSTLGQHRWIYTHAKGMLQEPSWYAQKLDALSTNAALAEGGWFHDCTLVLLWAIGHIYGNPPMLAGCAEMQRKTARHCPALCLQQSRSLELGEEWVGTQDDIGRRISGGAVVKDKDLRYSKRK